MTISTPKCFTLFIIILVTAAATATVSPLSSSSSTAATQRTTKPRKIPQILKVCHRNDPNLKECLRNSIESIRANLTDGIPELLIPPCEPLKIPEIHIKQNAGAIRIESAYSDMTIAGFSNFTLRDISVDVPKKRLQADLWFPKLEMTSNYLIHGKLLLMPITGSGKAYGNFTDVDATVVMHKKDNATTVHADGAKNNRSCDIKVEFNIGNASVKLDNLFNGDGELGSMMNQFLNTNWREITAEVRSPIQNSIENILSGIATQLNEMYDLDDIINE